MYILGLHSHKQGGKNYLAEVFKEMYGHKYNIQLLSFAYDMKVFLSELLGVHIEDFEDGEKKEKVQNFTFPVGKMAAIMYKEGYAPYISCEMLSVSVINECWSLGATGYHDEHNNVSIDTSLRTMLRALGQTLRSYDEHFWVTRAKRHISTSDTFVIFTDVRMPNEASICNTVVRIHTEDSKHDDHVTEQPLPKAFVHFNVINNYTHKRAVLNAYDINAYLRFKDI
ncbi:hypothetical protein [Vibrio phage VEN]|uniref:DNMP kinase n=1 Tax=Vibrio phage VEN TaxID=2059879 RepID=A0A2H5BMX4_9CAUD|nr:hypothetical protein HOS56_gp27 [Vibrio phage VEN]AUG87667.1 hypothetical protein [Vibrio phage VEN]